MLSLRRTIIMLLLRLLYLLLVMLICCQYTSSTSLTRVDNYSKTINSGQELGISTYYSDLACPNAEDIAPCICTFSADGEVMNLYCEDIADEQQLYDIFHAGIPFPQFSGFQLNTSFIEILSAGVFGDSTFEFVSTFSTYGILKFVDPNAFIKSVSTLKMLVLSHNELSDFPYETLTQYSVLDSFSLFGNPISSFPIIESQTLTWLDLSNTIFDTIPVGALDGLPNLESLYISGTNVNSMETGLFAHLGNLSYILMNNMKLTHLESYQFDVTSPFMHTINLDDNQIETVDVDTFKGLQSGGVSLKNNHLTVLDEVTWRPLVEAAVYLSFEGNDLTCGCDVAWLVLEPNFYDFVEDARCQSGELLVELDPSIFENCNLPKTGKQ